MRCYTYPLNAICKSPGAGLNRRPRPNQRRALPTEQPGQTKQRHPTNEEIHHTTGSNGTQPTATWKKWSGKRDSNPRPRAWKARALPTELFPHNKMVEREGFEPSKASPADLQSAPFGHSGTSPLLLFRMIPVPNADLLMDSARSGNKGAFLGAGDRI